MALQTTYNETQDQAVAGLIGTQIPATIISRTVETSAGIGFGVPVAQGTNDNGCILFASGTVLGIAALDRGATGEDKYAQYESARIITKGHVWVICTTGCSAGNTVWVRPSNATFQTSNANSGVQIANARWETTAAAGALALIRLG